MSRMHVCLCGHNRFEHFGRDGYCKGGGGLIPKCDCERYRPDKEKTERAEGMKKTLKKILGAPMSDDFGGLFHCCGGHVPDHTTICRDYQTIGQRAACASGVPGCWYREPHGHVSGTGHVHFYSDSSVPVEKRISESTKKALLDGTINRETERIMETQRRIMERMRFIARRVHEFVRQNGRFYGDEHDIFTAVLEAELEFAGRIVTSEILDTPPLGCDTKLRDLP
jgi:hypothetical protein